MAKVRPYTPEEDQIIRAWYPDYQAIMSRMAGRSRGGVEYRTRLLGVAKTKRVWTAPEVRRLARMRASGATLKQLEAAFPYRTLRSIQMRVRLDRIPLRWRFALTNRPDLDAIRARASEVGMTLTELDRALGSGRVFVNGNPSCSLRHVVAAAKLLGGRLEIEWQLRD